MRDGIFTNETSTIFTCKRCGNPAIKNPREKYVEAYDGLCTWCIVNDESLWKEEEPT